MILVQFDSIRLCEFALNLMELTYEGWLGALRGAELGLLAHAAGGVEGRAPGALAETALRTPASKNWSAWSDIMC